METHPWLCASAPRLYTLRPWQLLAPLCVYRQPEGVLAPAASVRPFRLPTGDQTCLLASLLAVRLFFLRRRSPSWWDYPPRGDPLASHFPAAAAGKIFDRAMYPIEA